MPSAEIIKIPVDRCGHREEVSRWELPYFLAGPENQLVEIAVRAVLQSKPREYFPVVFYGPSGTGKTHLAYGLAHGWKRQGHPSPVIIQTARHFHTQLMDALESQALADFLEQQAKAKLWILEDVEALAGKNFTQTQCTQLLDHFQAQGIPQVVTCRTLPGWIGGLDPRLQGRLTQGMTVHLSFPSLPTRRKFLEELAQANHLAFSPEAICLLAERIHGPLRSVQKVLMELAGSNGHGKKITSSKVHAYLEQYYQTSIQQIRNIAQLVGQQFSVGLRELRGPCRKKHVALARAVAVYLSRESLGLSFREIGNFFGRRDHTTILHCYQQIKKVLANDPTIRLVVENLSEKLRSNQVVFNQVVGSESS